MGIRKKIFLITAASMLAVLLLSYAAIYFYFYHSIFQETMINQRTNVELNRRMADTVSALVKGQDTFAAAGQPLPNYEVPVPKDSPLIGKSIGELKFWQSTGGTIVAIRRGQTVILSPGPYAELYSGDVIILVGSPSAAEAAHRLVTTKE